jgi:CIC family chloride channel protein
MMHAGAALGTALAERTRLDPPDARRLQTAAAGAGIAGAMNTPVAAALLVLPLLLRDRIDARAVAACGAAVAAGAGAHRWVTGDHPVMAALAPATDPTPGPGWAPAVAVGLLVPAGAAVGLGFVAALRTATRVVHRRRPGPDRLDPAFGGLISGLFVLAAPQVAGSSDVLTVGAGLAETATWALVGLLLAKIAATAVGVGFGGSGGTIGPLLVVGALLGELIGRAAGIGDGSVRVSAWPPRSPPPPACRPRPRPPQSS